jgi:glyoxylase-like metal-dependent hydrolase (beta-lactamase superfamily II)
MSEGIVFRQLLAGRDFATDDPVARQMVNFTYVIGDRASGDVALVDPAYGVDELVDLVEADGLRVTSALVTHWHADHCGGDLMGYPIQGIRELLARAPVPIHVQRDEAEWIERVVGIGRGDLTLHASGDTVTVGDVPITLLHTPGHTAGSQCFLVEGRLVSGDTLFLEGCGRTDLPGADPDEMYFSLTQRLATVPDDTVLYPGHLYSPEPSASLGEVRSRNYVFRLPTLEQWRTMFGGGAL